MTISNKLPISRRDWLRLSTAGVLGTSASGWLPNLARVTAADKKPRPKACILLWMNGGPSQGLTFDVKPDGPYGLAKTAVPGVQISEYLPKLADQIPNMALLRGMSTSASSHGTGHYLMSTGFPTGAMKRPNLGALVAQQNGNKELPLPGFVVVDGGNANGLGVVKPPFSPAYLGPRYAPMMIADPLRGIEGLKPTLSESTFKARAEDLEEDNKKFLAEYGLSGPLAHRTTVQRAVSLMDSPVAKSLSLENEKAELREKYGSHKFGQACLLARRLVESGVSFVEIINDGWDDHGGAIDKIKTRTFIDNGFATLLSDLKDRGLLDTTLVVWMGEFGRTPSIKHGGHHCKAWTTVLAGAGIRGGQVIGATDKVGDEVKERPIDAGTFAATILKALDIDPTGEYDHNGFMIPFVDKKAKPIAELF